MKYLILTILLVTAPACATVTPKVRIDQADRIAFESLHTFQTVEVTAFHACASPCSWDRNHRSINAKLSEAYTLVIDVANIGISLVPGQGMPASLTAELSLLTKTVADILSLIPGEAGPPVQASALTAQAKTTALVTTIQTGGK